MPKPSKRVAARQAELSRKKRSQTQTRPGPPSENTVSPTGFTTAEPSIEPAVAMGSTTSASEPTPPAPVRREPIRTPQGAFRQPAFRAASRTGVATPPLGAPVAMGSRRPVAMSPYFVSDLRAIGIVSILLIAGLIALKVIL